MAADDRHQSSELEELITSAADRQIAEERALRESLEGVEESVRELRSEVSGRTGELASSVLDAVQLLRSEFERLERVGLGGESTTAIRHEVAALGEGLEGLREGIEGLRRGGPGEAQSGLGELREEIIALRREIEGHAPGGGPEALAGVEAAAQRTARDVQGLAEAVLDLNSGLRSWAERVEEGIGSLGNELRDGIRELTSTQARALETLAETVSASNEQVTEDVAGLVQESTETLGSRVQGLEGQLTDASEISRYVHDQAEDLDRVLRSIGDVPQRLEGVVAQALRRALTVEAGLTRDAEQVLERTFRPLEGEVERLTEALERVSDPAEDSRLGEELRRLSLRQVELDSRLDDLQETVLASLEQAAAERREREEALAASIEQLSEQVAEGVERMTAAPGPAAVTERSQAPRARGRAAETTKAKTPKAKPKAKTTKPKAKTTRAKAKTTEARTTKSKAKTTRAEANPGASTGRKAAKAKPKERRRAAASGRRKEQPSRTRKTSAAKRSTGGKGAGGREGGGAAGGRTTTRTTNYIPV